MGRRRKLFLPQGCSRRQEYCLRFFVWNRWQRMLTRVGLGATRLLGLDYFLARRDLTRDVPHSLDAMSTLRRLSDGDTLKFSFSVGSPGPYQKISALAVSALDIGSVFLKYAASETADKTIDWETSWLSRLAAIESLRGCTPEMLGSGQLPCGRAYMLTDVSPSLETVPQFTPQHERFLGELGRATGVWGTYDESEGTLRINDMLASLEDVLGPAIHGDLMAGWQDALHVLADWEGPLIVAHRDFAPWNVRWSMLGVFVFDWEYAVQQANPLHDFYHFHLVQCALSNWKRVNPPELAQLMRSASDYAHQTYPNARWDEAVISALLLTYLLDVVLFYTDSRKLFDPKHPILSSYHSLIRSRARWFRK